MSSVVFHPSRLHGEVRAQPSKSEAHRALLLAALGRGACRVDGLPEPLCDDTRAMLNGVRALGAAVRREGDALVVTPPSAPAAPSERADCDVYACAAALRMLAPVFLARGQSVRFTMADGLFRRPMDDLDGVLKRIGASALREPGAEGEPASFSLSGTLRAGVYELDGARTSQFASGMLIALAHATDAQGSPAPSALTVRPIRSRPYLDMTLRQMRAFGMDVTEEETGRFRVPSAADRNPARVRVAGDWTQAAAFFCANALGGGVLVTGLSMNGEQGEGALLDALRAMGLAVWRAGDALCVTCPSRAGLSPVSLSCADMPDVAPLLALVCTRARGESTLSGVARLRLKECDRLGALLEALERLGASAALSPDGDTLHVRGPVSLRGGFTMDARGDHRIVMLLAVAALAADAPITVTGAQTLAKSWPTFLSQYRALGGVAR